MKPTVIPSPWRTALDTLGFTNSDAGLERDGLVLSFNGKWICLEDTSTPPARDFLRDCLDEPGLWKWIRSALGLKRVFQWPGRALELAPAATQWDGIAQPLTFENVVRWGMSTAAAKVVPGWPVPGREQCDQWASPEALTVQRAGEVRQGQWLVRPGRVALQIPILLDIPEDLPPARLAWIHALLHDAQDEWPSLRFGLVREDGLESAVAQVDLTGAPLCPLLISASLDALRHGASWLIESAELLADMRVASQALAVSPFQPKTERNYSNARSISHI